MRITQCLPSAALAALALATCVPASAQWMWKDEAGRVVASDQPPPPGTPPSRIMKAPRAQAAPPAPAAPAAPQPEAQKSVADRELDFKQRQKDAAEAQKKSDDDADRRRAMAENCTTVRGNLAGLQSGGRASRVNEKGERTYLDDAQRQAEIAKAQGQVSTYCKS